MLHYINIVGDGGFVLTRYNLLGFSCLFLCWTLLLNVSAGKTPTAVKWKITPLSLLIVPLSLKTIAIQSQTTILLYLLYQ